VKKYHTYFFDIDGTIFKYRKFERYENNKAELTPGALQKLMEIRGAGHTIILTTARPENLRLFTVTELRNSAVPYDQLVMGLARGPRHLINDMSPSKAGNRAISWNLQRDEGLADVEVEKIKEPEDA
jgi:ribonucleotide monophosphatase NagD (HAD superfamily)